MPINKDPSQAQLLQLWALCVSFIEEKELSCGEAVYDSLDQYDSDTHPFINDICNMVGFYEYLDEDEYPDEE